MLSVYSDVSMDHEKHLLSVGYVIFNSNRGTRELVDSGAKVIHTDVDDRADDWNTHKGEYFAGIVAVRAAQEQTPNESTERIILHVDNKDVADAMRSRQWDWEGYFPHALYSFLERFGNYDIEMVHRENNCRAHEQAHLGLRIGRDLLARQGSLN